LVGIDFDINHSRFEVSFLTLCYSTAK